MATVISQREARRLRKRVAELEQRENRRRSRCPVDYPGGLSIATQGDVSHWTLAALRTATTLGHYVIAVARPQDRDVVFYAVPWKDEGHE
jgi:hypothetical protein